MTNSTMQNVDTTPSTFDAQKKYLCDRIAENCIQTLIGLFEYTEAKRGLTYEHEHYKLSLTKKSDAKLTPEYLQSQHWEVVYDPLRNKYFWRKPGIKSKNTIWVEFENHYYRAFYAENKTFIALEDSIEWLESFCEIMGQSVAL